MAYLLTQDRGGPVDVTVQLAARLDAEGLAQVRLFGPRPVRDAERVEHLLEPTVVGGKGGGR